MTAIDNRHDHQHSDHGSERGQISISTHDDQRNKVTKTESPAS